MHTVFTGLMLTLTGHSYVQVLRLYFQEARICEFAIHCAWLRDCDCGMMVFCASQRYFPYNVLVTEESSTGVVRFQACELYRRERQKPCCGKLRSGSHYINKAGESLTPSHHGPVVCPMPYSLLLPNCCRSRCIATKPIKLFKQNVRRSFIFHCWKSPCLYQQVLRGTQNSSGWQVQRDRISDNACVISYSHARGC